MKNGKKKKNKIEVNGTDTPPLPINYEFSVFVSASGKQVEGKEIEK